MILAPVRADAGFRGRGWAAWGHTRTQVRGRFAPDGDLPAGWHEAAAVQHRRQIEIRGIARNVASELSSLRLRVAGGRLRVAGGRRRSGVSAAFSRRAAGYQFDIRQGAAGVKL